MKRSPSLSFGTVVGLGVAIIVTTIGYFSLLQLSTKDQLSIATTSDTPSTLYELVSTFGGKMPTCTYNNCLWKGNIENPEAVFGLAKLTGWRTTVTTMGMGDREVQCDAFVISRAPKPLLSFYQKYPKLIDENNRTFILLQLSQGFPNEYKDALLNSNAENPVGIVIFQRPPAGKGIADCDSGATILRTEEPDNNRF